MSNHVVQLVEMDLRQLDAINTSVSRAVKALKPCFTNCVDTKLATAAGVTLNVTAFA